MKNRDEGELLAAARNGEPGAFEELLRRYEGRVYRTVVRILRDPDDAADAYQTAVLRAFEKIQEFRGEASFGTWLCQIAVNVSLMRKRSDGRSPILSEKGLPRFNWMGAHVEVITDWTGSAEDQACRSQLREQLHLALDALPDADRTVVWLKDALGMNHQEIARATGSTVLAVRSRLHRTRLRLRETLADHIGGKGK